jgi:hypothetical protein
MTDDIAIREANQSDYPFIFSTWLRCYKHTSYFAKRIRNDVFFAYHHKIIEGILDRPKSIKQMAVLKNDPDVVIGYLIYEKLIKDTIHFIYLKKDWRGMGIREKLIEHEKIDFNNCIFTHWTSVKKKNGELCGWDKIVWEHPNAIYNPYLI